MKLVEDPGRLEAFKSKVSSLSWEVNDLSHSLDSLFYAIDDLAKAEVDYYYKRRKKWSMLSGIFRFFAWFFASIGIIIPLLGSLDKSTDLLFTKLGYVFLAVAGALLAINSLFSWTESHVRYLKTQLAIESLMTGYRIRWCKALMEFKVDGPEIDKAFGLIADYASELHNAIITESGEWGEAILTELKKYEKSANQRNKP